MAFQRAILPAVLSWADKLVMIGKYWNTYLIACQCYIYYIAYTGAPYIIYESQYFHHEIIIYRRQKVGYELRRQVPDSHSPVRVIMKQTFITGKSVPHGDGRASDTLILWTMKDSNG